MTTQIDFYILTSTTPDAGIFFMCRLTEKAFKLGHRIYIQTQNQQHTQVVDDALWTFRESSFIPHTPLATHHEDTPITINHTSTTPNTWNDIMINLCPTAPLLAQQFARVIEIVEPTEPTRALARERFRTYKQQKFQVFSHEING